MSEEKLNRHTLPKQYDPVFWKSYTVTDPVSGRPVTFEGWSHVREERHGHQPIGIFDSYASALAAYRGEWEAYCEFHRRRA